MNLNALRIALAAGAMTLSLGGTAAAQDNRDAVLRGIFAEVLTTAANRASTQQQGTGNAGAITQNGVGNTAGIRQFGRNNTGAISQDGNYNDACLIQFGRNLDARIEQTGDRNAMGVVQTRRGVTEVPPELCALDGTRRGLFIAGARHAARRIR